MELQLHKFASGQVGKFASLLVQNFALKKHKIQKMQSNELGQCDN